MPLTKVLRGNNTNENILTILAQELKVMSFGQMIRGEYKQQCAFVLSLPTAQERQKQMLN